jgi:hypothetical protein
MKFYERVPWVEIEWREMHTEMYCRRSLVGKCLDFPVRFKRGMKWRCCWLLWFAMLLTRTLSTASEQSFCNALYCFQSRSSWAVWIFLGLALNDRTIVDCWSGSGLITVLAPHLLPGTEVLQWNFGPNSRCSSLDSNWTPPDCEPRELPLCQPARCAKLRAVYRGKRLG